MDGNVFSLGLLPEGIEIGLASAIHRLADEEQDTGSRRWSLSHESNGANPGIDHAC